MKYKDFPLSEIIPAVDKLVAEGWDVYQKWTCEGCGDRVTATNPNTITTHGYHDDCGHTTDITKTGCNYLKAKVF